MNKRSAGSGKKVGRNMYMRARTIGAGVIHMAAGKYAEWLDDDNLILIAAWARDGLTFDQIAKNMGISCSTLRDWRSKYPAISVALKKGREITDVEVENSLYKNAIGYKYTEEIAFKCKIKEFDERGKIVKEEEIVKIVEIKKYAKAETGAAAFWLKNRKPETWRDRRDDDADRNAEIIVKIEGAEGMDE